MKKIGRSGPGHLWFLYYLMMLYPLMPVCAYGRRFISRRGWAPLLERLTASPWLPVALAVVTMLTLWPYKGGFVTWLFIYSAIGLFQRFLDRDSPWVAYISQSSYWVYLVHLPIVSLAAWSLVDVDVAAVVKFLLAGAFTALVAFSSYHYLVRRSWISVLLNGRRFSLRWPWLEQEGISYSTAMGPSASPVKN